MQDEYKEQSFLKSFLDIRPYMEVVFQRQVIQEQIYGYDRIRMIVEEIDDGYNADQVSNSRMVILILSILQHCTFDSEEIIDIVMNSHFLEVVFKILYINYYREEGDPSPTLNIHITEKLIIILYKILIMNNIFIDRYIDLGIVDLFSSIIDTFPQKFKSPFFNLLLYVIQNTTKLNEISEDSLNNLISCMDSLLFSIDPILKKNSAEILCHLSKVSPLLSKKQQNRLVFILKELVEVNMSDLDLYITISCYNILNLRNSDQIDDIDFFIYVMKRHINNNSPEIMNYAIEMLILISFKFDQFDNVFQDIGPDTIIKCLESQHFPNKVSMINYLMEIYNFNKPSFQHIVQSDVIHAIMYQFINEYTKVKEQMLRFIKLMFESGFVNVDNFIDEQFLETLLSIIESSPKIQHLCIETLLFLSRKDIFIDTMMRIDGYAVLDDIMMDTDDETTQIINVIISRANLDS